MAKAIDVLTARELEIIIAVAAVVKSMGVPWEEVATKANFNTAKQARDKYAAAVNKLKAIGERAREDGDSAAGTPTPSSGKKVASAGKKRKGAGDADADTPSKKGKKTKEVSPLVDEEEEDDEAPNVKAEMEDMSGIFT